MVGAVKLNSVQLLMRWELLYMLDPETRLSAVQDDVHLGAVKLNSVQLLMRWELLYMLDPEIRLRLSRMALIILHFLRNRRTFHKPRDYSRGNNSHYQGPEGSLN